MIDIMMRETASSKVFKTPLFEVVHDDKLVWRLKKLGYFLCTVLIIIVLEKLSILLILGSVISEIFCGKSVHL